jgi:predicted Zn-dependent protease with MMP-like domain
VDLARDSPRHWKSVTHTEFETLVERALRTLPGRFKEKIANVAIVVEDWADDETLRELGIEPPDTLYGLYRGIDLTRRDTSYGNVLPDTIHIYQAPSRKIAPTPKRWPSSFETP